MMRFTYLLFMAAFLFVACDNEKDLYVPNEGERRISDLNVPADFDWKTTQDVAFSVTSENTVYAEIYADKNCSAGSMIGGYASDTEGPMYLSLPAYTKELYVKAGGVITTASIQNGVVQLNIPSTRAAEEANPEGEVRDNVAYYPTFDGWATMLFEDMFPEIGDYDFNDFVANYKYEANWSRRGNNDKIDKIVLSMRVLAAGGLYEISPRLRLVDIHNNDITSVEIIGGSEGITVERVTTKPSAEAVFEFKGLIDKPTGNKFLNTVPAEQVVCRKDLKNVKVVITLDNSSLKKGDLRNEDFDFYLAKKDYEIHQKGYEAVDSNLYPASHSNLGSTPFATTSNLVWAMTVPVDLKHLIEEVSFLKAYTAFADWAEDKSNARIDWYNAAPVDEYIFKIPEE